jgi:DNA polymerase-4
MTELVLASLGIYTCSDILAKAVEVYLSFSERTGYFLFRAALGISRNYHEEDNDEDACQKSISVSSTSRKPTVTLEQFREKIVELSEELAERIDKRKVAGITVSLEIKSVKYEVIQKSVTIKTYIWLAEDLQRQSFQILDSVWPCEKARLIGIKLSGLKNQADVRKDKQLTQFFKGGVSAEEYQLYAQN